MELPPNYRGFDSRIPLLGVWRLFFSEHNNCSTKNVGCQEIVAKWQLNMEN